MRKLRELKQGVWYEIRSQINNREPLFCEDTAREIFDQVFRETKLRFVFEIRRRRLEGDLLTFYIKPEDGLQLPEIMKWMKQTFAQRYNRRARGNLKCRGQTPYAFTYAELNWRSCISLFRFVSAHAAGIIRLHLRISGRAGENSDASNSSVT
ncbi:MAG: hypothetical protein LBP80_01705, partial [Treponema sp.]|nr:hypothetical protein [Treponema sp.]